MNDNITDWTLAITSVISAAIALASLIATIRMWYLNKRNVDKEEQRKKQIRTIAIKALNIFSEYANGQNNTYDRTESQFNNTMNKIEKRMILVCLHKIGIPILTPLNSAFKIEKVSFENEEINVDDIQNMKAQVEIGNCDQLFFLDVEQYFTENQRIKAIRNIGIKFVRTVLQYSNSIDNTVVYQNHNWFEDFTVSELNFLLVFRIKTLDTLYYHATGKVKSDELEQLISDIKIGLWDQYLQWDIANYKSIENANAFYSALINKKNTLPSNQNQEIENINLNLTPNTKVYPLRKPNKNKRIT